MHHDDTYVIIPVYNEAGAIGSVIAGVAKEFRNIICVNDGSTDESASKIKKTSATLINHPMNLGQGAALQTGIEYALLDPKARYFITFDSDGQHDISDAVKMLDYIRKQKVDIVLGSRFLGSTENMTGSRRLLLKLAVRFSNRTTGLKLTDAHNGLRVMNRHMAENIKISMPDMAHATEIIQRIADGEYKYAEIPVTISYSDYSKAKGQSVLNTVNIVFDLLVNKASKK